MNDMGKQRLQSHPLFKRILNPASYTGTTFTCSGISINIASAPFKKCIEVNSSQKMRWSSATKDSVTVTGHMIKTEDYFLLPKEKKREALLKRYKDILALCQWPTFFVGSTTLIGTQRKSIRQYRNRIYQKMSLNKLNYRGRAKEKRLHLCFSDPYWNQYGKSNSLGAYDKCRKFCQIFIQAII